MAAGGVWTGDRIVAAIREWAERTGKPPTAKEWREAPGTWPHPQTVIRVFGSWSEAIAAAGFVPRRRGGQPSRAGRRSGLFAPGS